MLNASRQPISAILAQHAEEAATLRNIRSRITSYNVCYTKLLRAETVDKNETITIHGARTETVDKDEALQIGGNRSESVAKDESIAIDGSRSETVAKDESVAISGGRSVSVRNNFV